MTRPAGRVRTLSENITGRIGSDKIGSGQVGLGQKEFFFNSLGSGRVTVTRHRPELIREV